ncbi:MAG: Tol-Pal system protein TolB [Chlamydiia bacterium]|nr:Tol-Pal system protein TolB [Chlamydiia bacterium]
MKFFPLILATLLPFALFAQIDEDEITIELSTQTEIAPVYMSHTQHINIEVAPGYIKQLEHALVFDLSHNGYMQVLPTEDYLEEQAKKDAKGSINLSVWNENGIQYILLPAVTGKQLSLSIYNPQLSKYYEVPGLYITGRIDRDLEHIHKLADDILFQTLGIEGIATTKILYSYQPEEPSYPGSEDWQAEIWEADYTGTNARQCTHQNSYSITPVVIPSPIASQQMQFLYVCFKQGQPKIYLGSNGNGKSKKILSLRGNQILPAIAPQGDKIAFVSDASGRASLFLQSFDPMSGPYGKPIQIYSTPKGVVASSSFSPDGSKLAFVSDESYTPRIYLVDLMSAMKERKTPQVTCLTKACRENTAPCFSHDGKKLAYSAKVDGVRQIWIYDFETGKETQLTSGTEHKENPSFAPNDLHLIYNTTSPTFDLYLINLNQKRPTRLTHGPGKKHYPSWSPNKERLVD